MGRELSSSVFTWRNPAMLKLKVTTLGSWNATFTAVLYL